MSDDCKICDHPAHDGRRCDYPKTETVRDDVGIFARPTGFVREIIVGRCCCGLVDSVVEEFGIDLADIGPYLT